MKKSYHIYAIITILLWSIALIFTKLALQYFDVYSVSFLRYLSASLTLLIFMFFIKMSKPKKEDFLTFLLAGLLGFSIYMIIFTKGAGMLNASTGSIILAMTPIITAILAFFFYKEKLKLYQWFAILCEFIGIIVLTLLNGTFSANEGILWLLLGDILFASYNLLQRKLTTKYTALEASTYSIFIGTIFLFIFSPQAIPKLIVSPLPQIGYILILGVFSSALAYLSWSKAISLAEKTSSVANYMFVTPFLTSIFSFLIIGEIPDKATILGGIIILSGLFLFNKESFLPSKDINKL